MKIRPSIPVCKHKMDMFLFDGCALKAIFKVVTDFAVLLIAIFGHAGLVDQWVLAGFGPIAI